MVGEDGEYRNTRSWWKQNFIVLVIHFKYFKEIIGTRSGSTVYRLSISKRKGKKKKKHDDGGFKAWRLR